MRGRKDIEPILKELREELVKLYGERLDRLVLYGSQARGDAGPDSDIDVLVVLHGIVRPGEEILRTSETRARISLMNDAVISCAYVSSDDYAESDSALLLNARSEGQPI